MPWAVTDVMDQRFRFILEATKPGSNLSQVCRRFGISRPTGYLWLKRYKQESFSGLIDRSRKPHRSPNRTPSEIENLVLSYHQQFGEGAKKIAFYLAQNEGIELPAITAHRILKRHGKVKESKTGSSATKRFERSDPNALWQMDFKGPFKKYGKPCYPLSILDDHSRYLVGLHALSRTNGVQTYAAILKTFSAFGLPAAMLMDHGTPWWSTTSGYGLTWVSVALIKQGIRLSWSGISHPQTQGKVERFHRSLKAAIKHQGGVSKWDQWQETLNEYRTHYNEKRPHEALQMRPPASRYVPSSRQYQQKPPAWEYPEGAIVRRLSTQGCLQWNNRYYFVCEAMAHESVAIWELDGKLLVQFRQLYVREINLRTNSTKAIVLPTSTSMPPQLGAKGKKGKCKGCHDNEL